jgi:hypothetical protein
LNDPPTVTWKGGRKVLVITGDLIDKGCDSVGVIMLVRALQSDAATKGGGSSSRWAITKPSSWTTRADQDREFQHGTRTIKTDARRCRQPQG